MSEESRKKHPPRHLVQPVSRPTLHPRPGLGRGNPFEAAGPSYDDFPFKLGGYLPGKGFAGLALADRSQRMDFLRLIYFIFVYYDIVDQHLYGV